MEIGSGMSALSTGALASAQGQAQLMVLKKANDIEAQSAMQLIQALPAVAEPGQPGAVINTFA